VRTWRVVLMAISYWSVACTGLLGIHVLTDETKDAGLDGGDSPLDAPLYTNDTLDADSAETSPETDAAIDADRGEATREPDAAGDVGLSESATETSTSPVPEASSIAHDAADEGSTGCSSGATQCAVGRLTLLRAGVVGDVWGAPGDSIQAEAFVKLDSDSDPGQVYGLMLQQGPDMADHMAAFKSLVAAFKGNVRITLEYTAVSAHTGRIRRVLLAR
jgi:hypothetical protein